MDRVSVGQIHWRGVDAWSVRSSTLEFIVTQVGAHIAVVRERGADLNPLWQPPWPAADPAEGVAHSETYGGNAEASLLAGIVGHNLCLDRFGPPRDGETRPVHGEAGTSRWRVLDDEPYEREAFVIVVDLAEARLHLERAFRFDGPCVEVATSVSHADAGPRTVEWAEHVTIGDPFLDGATFSADADGAWISGGEPREFWRFPDASAEGPVDPAAALAMPAASDEGRYGDIVTARLVSGRFSAERADLGWTLEYEWDSDEFPWLCIWTQHHSRSDMPWHGLARARGMEFSTKPFPEGEPPADRAELFHGRPTQCVVPPGAGLERRWRLRWHRA